MVKINKNNNSKNCRKNVVLYTYPLISSSNQKWIEFSSIQFDILKLVEQKASVYTISNDVGKEASTVRYHLKKLNALNLVYRDCKFGRWMISDSGKQVIKDSKRRKIIKKNRVVKKGCHSKERQPNNKSLTPRESLVYSMHVEERKPQNLISVELGCTKQNVSRIFNKAKNKLVIMGGDKKEVVRRVSGQPLSPLRYRCHNFRWRIQILKKLDNFSGVLNDEINNNTIKVWEDSIEIYSSLDFFSNSKEDAFFDGLKYFCSLFMQLEKLYGCVLNISGINNKKLVKCDLAETGNEMATTCIKEGNKVIFRDSKGVAWATIDNSFNFFEFEVIAAGSLLPDMEVVQKHLNDWRQNPNCPTLSELSVLHDEVMLMFKAQLKVNSQFQEQLSSFKK